MALNLPVRVRHLSQGRVGLEAGSPHAVGQIRDVERRGEGPANLPAGESIENNHLLAITYLFNPNEYLRLLIKIFTVEGGCCYIRWVATRVNDFHSLSDIELITVRNCFYHV
jgi:hypothetical protein